MIFESNWRLLRFCRFAFHAPNVRKFLDIGDALDCIVRLLYLPLWLLGSEFAATDTDGVHGQFVPGADLTHGPVTHHQHLARLKSEFLLYLPEGCFLGEQVLPVRVEDTVNGRSPVKAKRANLGFLNFWLAKAHHKTLDATSMEKAQQRHSPGEKRQLTYRAVEVGISCGFADGHWISSAKMLTHHGVNVPQHGIVTKGLHTRAIGSVNRGIESGLDHGPGCMVVCGFHPLAEAIVKRVIQIKNDTADRWRNGNAVARNAFFSGSRRRSHGREKDLLLYTLARDFAFVHPFRFHYSFPFKGHRDLARAGGRAVTISFMEAMLLRISWLLGVGYSSIPLFWFAIHPFAGTWRRLHWSPYRAPLPIWAVVILVEIWITWPWHALRLYSALFMWLVALPFFVLGWRTYRRIFAEFGGRNLSGTSEIRNEADSGSLVNTGMHARMRHPIYFAHLCNFAGLTIGSGLTVNFVLLAISLIMTYPLMIALEERELEMRFGNSYREYKESVPLLPFATGSRKMTL